MNNFDEFPDRLEVFFGDATETVAHVYARLRVSGIASQLHLTGTLRGPSCHYGKTLQATFPLRDRGPGNSLVVEAIVPEPCFWTPEMPQLYQADLQLCRRDEIVAHASRIFGIRRLGAEGRKLMFDGKGWVLRAVCRDKTPAADLSQWRESDAAMLVRDPTGDLCDEASRVGVLLVADLDVPAPSAFSPHGRGQGARGDVEWAQNKIHRLSRWPAVGIAVVPKGTTIDSGALPRNLLLAERFRPDQSVVPAAWASIAICEVEDPNTWTAWTADCKIPIIAARPAASRESVATARSLCDRLQRDLAGRGEIAGYII